jgi:hypothetical protein
MGKAFPIAELVGPPGFIVVGLRDPDDDRTDRVITISRLLTMQAIAVRLMKAPQPSFEPFKP